ncbi:hypothetical protein RND81_13G085900 [Saponaria officinalis]|uniref:Cation/H+ exchanger domain-containing protein n=1 Tax=Saponaria officinalis TaxID=3572 RepID=A0AAW1GYB3_SAPOF
MSNNSIFWNEGVAIGSYKIACQGYFERSQLFDGLLCSISSAILIEIGLVLSLYRFVRLLLKPLGMPNVAQMLAGFIVGPFFELYVDSYSVHKPSLLTIISILSHIGFYLHLFLLGVEINLRKVAKTGKKAFVISLSGLFTSLAFSYVTCSKVKRDEFKFTSLPIILYNAFNYLMSTASHLNDLGISNSKLGQLASSASMIIDMSVMLLSLTTYNIVYPLIHGREHLWKCLLVLYYALLFFGFRPLLIYILSLKPEGKPMKQMHFIIIVVTILVLALMGECIDQKFSPFLVALSLPEEPLATILAERLDPFISSVLYPFFIITRGMDMDFQDFDKSCNAMVVILSMGYLGKFFGTIISARLFRLPFSQAITLSLIMSARGVLDISALSTSLQYQVLKKNHYTIYLLHSAITMGVLLPFAKFFYEPSKQYSTLMRHSIVDFHQYDELLKILVCIHKEENLPGLLRILRVCHSTPENPISVMVLQLLQLTGRCTMPIMAPLHEVSSISSLRSNIDRCTNIVNSFLSLERETEGMTRAQHYVAMSPYTTMHNDICNLAYEKTVGLVILPFHTSWANDGAVKDTSLSIREVNNMVLKKAPCSVGVLIDRSRSQPRVFDEDGVLIDQSRSHPRFVDEGVYMISVIFVGGVDDYEALAYSRLFASHPSVRLNVLWLKAPTTEETNELDYEVMKKFHKSCRNNDRISFNEVVVNNGAETVQVMVSIKDHVDLVVTGMHHHLESTPMLGLSDGWSEYPELGVLGDMFASSDFEFSLLIVQLEPQNEFTLNFEK